MAAPPDNRRRRATLVAAVILIVALAVGLVLWLMPRQAALPDAVQVDTATSALPATKEKAEPVEPPSARNETPAAVPQPETRKPEPAAEGKLVVRCVDTAGNRVAGVRIKWQTVRAEPRMRRSSDPAGESLTDAQGEVELRGPPAYMADVEVIDESWYAPEAHGLFSATEPLVMTLRPARAIRFRAQYDDGQPVLYLAAFSDLTRGGYSADFSLQNEGRATIARVPVDAPLRCNVFAGQRAGYASHREEISVAQLTSGNELLVIVPKSGGLGGIRVEFLNGQCDSDTEWMIESEDDRPQRSSMSSSRAAFEKAGLRPGKYRVTITGKRAWRSEWLTVLPGEQTVVQANLLDGGTVKARLVDEQGAPIEGGVLRLPNGAYQTFNVMGRAWLTFPVSDAKGLITLTGLPPIPMTIEAEAFGRDIVRKEVTLPAGGEYDLGDIMLPAAPGTVTVELTGMKEGYTYHVGLVQPKGMFCMEVKASGNTVRLAGVALRKYRVGIKPGEFGGAKLSDEFELTASKPTHTVQIDVSGVEPAKIIHGPNK